MTEADARAKWCPWVRYVPQHKPLLVAAINRWLRSDDKQWNPEPARCIASDCMLWRWAERDELAQDRWPEETLRKLERQGDCGLKR